jgi:mRNA-degrading endonuclease RelE of RelBE toxin-antitoxin system
VYGESVADVIITPAAQADFDALPRVIQGRVLSIFVRLGKWPAVSGAKPLRGELHGSYRIRTGGWRVIFTPTRDDQTVLVSSIDNRRDAYK